ncbi:39S ribosomal protein L30, mitochondrial [Periophthalmus magnuspinnatus]|uniref:39S ribosomal protein L30, mitochondrial n=1 Tax=Periophthalmus magnuspinnatus TaxID=409849 RepID=UPI00145B4FD9|nr:39S ribosomal protein L30, mitochondrial [Periophthalmus magnuspinnatus]
MSVAGVCQGLRFIPNKIIAGATQLPCLVLARGNFTRSRMPLEIFEERSKEHEKYGGDPEQPHKLHIVTRIKSTIRRPYWEKEMVKSFGLRKMHAPVIHKNTPAVNNQLKYIKHLVRIQPLKTPYGLPAEQDMAETYINVNGELIVKRLLQPVETKAVDS